MVKISIIIPTYKREKSLVRLLKSLEDQVSSTVEILIIEQKFNHEKMFRNAVPQIEKHIQYTLLPTPHTAHAKNVGILQAKGKYILFLDDDVIVGSKLLINHCKNFNNTKIAGVSGRVITVGQPIESNNMHVGKISRLGTFSDGYSSLIKQMVDTVIGCNACWRKDILLKVGMFDERFTGNAMREESDLSLKVLNAGYQIVFEPEACVTHLRESYGGARKSEGRMAWYFDFFSNETYFFLKHRNFFFVPVIMSTRWQWIIKCMFGFGREVSIKSFVTPFLGMVNGMIKYKQYIYENRS